MNFFTCVLAPNNRALEEGDRRAYESVARSRGLAFKWQSTGRANVLSAWDEAKEVSLVATYRQYGAAGVVRLDNRRVCERWAGREAEQMADLDIVLRIVAHHGSRFIPQILGDFAFVVWDEATGTAVAACDAMAVKKLYYAYRRGLRAFSSRAEPLADGEQYDVRYLLEFLTLDDPSSRRSVYAGVQPIPAASIATLVGAVLKVDQYWDAGGFTVESRWTQSEPEAVHSCRELLVEAVRLRLGGNGETWAQLSGGLDSSTVVSLAQWLVERGDVPHGLAGTVTYVDRQGDWTDERAYSDAVMTRWRVDNKTVLDAPLWYEDGHPRHLPDQPRFDFPFSPRNRRLTSIVRSAGGKILLTGWGGDELFMGSMVFFADWIVKGRAWAAIRELARRAAIGRVSFWELAFKNAAMPLLPSALLHRMLQHECPIQPWITRATLRRHGVVQRAPIAAEYAGALGRKYHHAIAVRVRKLGNMWNRDGLADGLDVRHPFLYRPLIEFALRLPPELRARPHAHRWIVREAMRGILPEAIRTRVGKPETSDILARCLSTRRPALAQLLHAPILADLGIVDGHELRIAFDGALQRNGREQYAHPELVSALAVEAWLQMRSGRWPRGGQLSSGCEAVMQE
ncbi:MAG: asparagine synthase-related protein [Gemmatimonadales bacterium]